MIKKHVYLLLFCISIFLSCKVGKQASTSKLRKELSEQDQINFKYHFFNANKEKMIGNYELALTNFMQCYKIDNTDPATMYEIAFLLSLQGKKQPALEFSKKAAEQDFKNEWYQQLYAELLETNAKFSEAADVYERIIKENPLKVDLYYQWAEAFIYAKKYDKAIKVYDMLEEMIGIEDETSMQKIRLYKQVKKIDKAIDEAKKIIRKYPKEAKYYGVLGELYQEKGMREKTFETYNSFLALEPNNAMIHLSLADYYRSEKQDDKAFEEIKIAFKNSELDIDNKIKILLNYYTVTEVKPEYKQEADELCKILVDVHSDDAKSYSMYADFLYRDKKYEEARNQYRKAIELDKSKYLIWNQLILIDSELNDYTSLEKESSEAIELFPNQPIPYLLNGIAKSQLKKEDEAIKIWIEGINYVVKNDMLLSQFYSNLGDTYHKKKEYAHADEAYDKALELDSKNSYVLNNYSYYLSLRKERLEEAEAMSKKSLDLEPNNASFLDTYGWILYQRGNYQEALKWIEKAIEKGGKNAVILEHYGDIFYKLGELQKALENWIEAKKLGEASEFLNKKIEDKKLYE